MYARLVSEFMEVLCAKTRNVILRSTEVRQPGIVKHVILNVVYVLALCLINVKLAC